MKIAWVLTVLVVIGAAVLLAISASSSGSTSSLAYVFVPLYAVAAVGSIWLVALVVREWGRFREDPPASAPERDSSL